MNERRVKPDGRLRQRERFLREESQTLDEWYKNPDSVWSASVSPSAGTWVPTPKREHDRVASQATASPSVASPMLPLESHDETPVSPASGLSRTWSWWFNDSEQPRCEAVPITPVRLDRQGSQSSLETAKCVAPEACELWWYDGKPRPCAQTSNAEVFDVVGTQTYELSE